MENERVITVKPGGAENDKPLIIISAKIAEKAVLRNKIRRRIRNIIREYPEKYLRGRKIIVGPAALNLSYQELKKEIEKIIIKG